MIDAIKWFHHHGFTYDDKITIGDVIWLQDDARRQGVTDAAQIVHDEGLFQMSEHLLKVAGEPCSEYCKQCEVFHMAGEPHILPR